MNKKQADDIINLIQTNINAKKQDVEAIYNQDVEKPSDFSTINVENEFSILGKMHQTLNGDDEIKHAIQAYVSSQKINNANISKMAKDEYKTKVKSLDKFENQLFEMLKSDGASEKKFNSFVHYAYEIIKQKLNNTIDATPSALLKLMNDNRNAIGLTSVQTFDSSREILSSYYISQLVKCGEDDVQLETLVKNVNNFTKLYGYEIATSYKDENYLPVVRQLYDVVLDNFAKNETFDFIANKNKFDSDITKGLERFAKLGAQIQNDVRDSVNKVAALLLTNRTLALILDNKSEYIQISKIIRTDACNQLCYIVSKFDNCSVTYAISEIVKNGFVKICDKLSINEKACYARFGNNGLKINEQDSSITELSLDEQLEETNNNQITQKKVFDMNFEKIAKQGYYVELVNTYIAKFNKLFSDKKFVANAKIDLDLESVKIQSIGIDVKQLIELVEQKGHATEEQFKVFVDAHAYGVVSNSVLKGLAKQYFDIDVDKVIEAQVQEVQLAESDSKTESERTLKFVPEIVYDTQEFYPVIQEYKPKNYVVIEDFNSDSIIVGESASQVAEEKTAQEEQVEDNVVEEVIKQADEHEEKPQQIAEVSKEQNETVVEKTSVQTDEAITEMERKADEERKKLNELNERQKREIEELKRQLAQAQAKNQNTVSASTNTSKSEKMSILSSKIETALTEAFRLSIKNLANLDFDLKAGELNKSILHTNQLTSSTRKLLTSLNAYLALSKSESEQVNKNSFINNNTEQTAKDIMKFEYYLKKFIKSFADKIAESIESDDKPVEVLINEAIEKYCNKYVETMAQNKKAEIVELKNKYGDDEYEFDIRMDMLNDKYYGNNGLLNTLKSNYLSLLTKDIVISQIKEIDSAETSGVAYVFNKQKLNDLLNVIVNNNGLKEQEDSLIKE